jgi:hypothetical protein
MIEVAGGNSITTVVLKVDMNRRIDMYTIIYPKLVTDFTLF